MTGEELMKYSCHLPEGNPLSICFDVDGVLCDDSDSNIPYAKRKPYPWVSEVLHNIKTAGHTIKIQTARYMNKFDGNQLKAIEHGKSELIFWLKEHNIPFDEVYLGKAGADYYLDDKAFRMESNKGCIDWLFFLSMLLA